MGFCGAGVSSAAAGTITWTCKVNPQSWCEYPVAHDYYQNEVTNAASFTVSAFTKFVLDTSGADLAIGQVNNCNSCIYPAIVLYVPNLNAETYPLVYNPDPSNARNFTIYSSYYY